MHLPCQHSDSYGEKMGGLTESKNSSQLNQKVDFLFYHTREFWDSDPGFSQGLDTVPTACFLITHEFALNIEIQELQQNQVSLKYR